MNLDFTKLIQTAMILIVVIYAVGEFAPKVDPPKEVVIDYSVRDSISKVVHRTDSLINELQASINLLKKNRNNVPKQVAAYSDSDVIRFNDSIRSAYNIK